MHLGIGIPESIDSPDTLQIPPHFVCASICRPPPLLEVASPCPGFNRATICYKPWIRQEPSSRCLTLFQQAFITEFPTRFSEPQPRVQHKTTEPKPPESPSRLHPTRSHDKLGTAIHIPSKSYHTRAEKQSVVDAISQTSVKQWPWQNKKNDPAWCERS